MKTRLITAAVILSAVLSTASAQRIQETKHETAPSAGRDNFICQYFPALCR